MAEARRAALARLRQFAQQRWALLLAAAFAVYSALLLYHTVDTWRQMRADAQEWLVTDSKRRVAALSDTLTELRMTALAQAELHEIHAFLSNRDLGMSMRYGLAASLGAIEARFRDKADAYARLRDGVRPRFVYFSAGGERLADSARDDTYVPAAIRDESAGGMRIDILRGLIEYLVPVKRHERDEGVVITIVPIEMLYRHQSADESAAGYREFLMRRDGRLLPRQGYVPQLETVHLEQLTTLTEDTVVAAGRFFSGHLDNAFLAGSLMVRSNLPDTPLTLVTVMPQQLAYGNTLSLPALAGAGAILLLMMAGAWKLDRMRGDAERLRIAAGLAEQRRELTETRNQALQEEIDRRVAVEQALALSEQRWALAINGTNDGVWDWDIKTGAVFFSDRTLAMLGYAPGEMQGSFESWRDGLHPEDVAPTVACLNDHLLGKTAFYQAEFRLRCRDGSYKWILGRGKALFDAEGQAIRMAGSHTDISERKAGEEQIRDRTGQLNAIFDLSPDGFVAFDATHRVRYVSAAFLRMTGLDEQEVAGLDEAAFFARLAGLCAVPEHCPAPVQLRAAQKVGAGGTAIAGTAENMGTAIAGTADNVGTAPRHVIELAAPGKPVLEIGMRVAGSDSTSSILYFRDITHETEVDRMKSEFLSHAAHELRTPMASIYGFSEVMLAQSFDPAEQREYLETIYRNSGLMISIINELLDLVRIEERRGKDFIYERLDMTEVLRAAVGDFGVPAGRAAPLLSLPEVPCQVRGDRNKLARVIFNILSNAYKYSPQGGPVTATLVAGKLPDSGANVCGIRIADHGLGLTSEQLARVCERFYRADASGKIPGTGLGMSIVKEIVSLHCGRLAIDSSYGAGTTVTVWLPAVPREERAGADAPQGAGNG